LQSDNYHPLRTPSFQVKSQPILGHPCWFHFKFSLVNPESPKAHTTQSNSSTQECLFSVRLPLKRTLLISKNSLPTLASNSPRAPVTHLKPNRSWVTLDRDGHPLQSDNYHPLRTPSLKPQPILGHPCWSPKAHTTQSNSSTQECLFPVRLPLKRTFHMSLIQQKQPSGPLLH
jgi:hypothetical protein